MKIQLSHIDQAPAGLPIWQTIIDDLCHPPAHRIAKVLGIGERTVYRYHAQGHAPRVVLLALFWLTRWGRDQVNCKAENDARQMAGLARALGEDRDRMRSRIEQLEADAKMRTDRIHFVSPEHSETVSAEEESGEEFTKRDRLEGVTRTFRPAVTSGALPPAGAEALEPGNREGSAAVLAPALRARSSTEPTTSTEPGNEAFGAIVGALRVAKAGRNGSRRPQGGHAGASEARDLGRPAGSSRCPPPSLPLADLMDARAGTPPSAPAASRLPGPAGRKAGDE